MAKVLFLHGLDAQPGGVKPTYLLQQGHEVLNPSLPREDFERSVQIAERACREGQPDVVVGSSRGGAVALALDRGHCPIILLAPAWKFFLPDVRITGPTHVIHAPTDALIPIEHSRELAVRFPNHVQLFEMGDRHTLTDPASLARLDASVRELVR